jgi:hypothetical protein
MYFQVAFNFNLIHKTKYYLDHNLIGNPISNMLSPSLGITKYIVSLGPQVPYMECRELDDLSNPIFIQVQCTYQQQQRPSHWVGPEVVVGLSP